MVSPELNGVEIKMDRLALQELLKRLNSLERAMASFNDESSKEEAERLQLELSSLRVAIRSFQSQPIEE